ncbi:hypothetical protein [Actinoallomurus sp. NPDC050550]|uniref:hypothetical protein n=1 Tax=Actinoallomurus sp. NPDC050550 TaxID=3154937 RepID=UPI0033C97005
MLIAAAFAASAAAGTAWAIGSATGTTWTASLLTVTAAATAGGILYALIAHVLRITEFKALTAALPSVRHIS